MLLVVIIIIIITIIVTMIMANMTIKYNSINYSHCKKYIISMKSSHERKLHIKDTFKYDYEIFNAILGKDVKNSKYFDTSKLSDGQIGCFCSHINLWEKIILDNEPAYIFEDDVLLVDTLETLLIPYDADILFMGHCAETKGTHFYSNVYKSITPRCTHGYFISPNGAKKILDSLENEKPLYVLPVDEYLADLIRRNKIVSYSLHPTIANTGDLKSTIN